MYEAHELEARHQSIPHPQETTKNQYSFTIWMAAEWVGFFLRGENA